MKKENKKLKDISRVVEIREKLVKMSNDAKYQKFTTSLIPGCDNILGVRLPKLRELAKEISKDNPIEYLRNREKEIYFEEVMLKGMIIGNLKLDIELVLDEVEYFIPKINNWSVTDSFCSGLKIVRKNKERVFKFLKPYYTSTETYYIRFAIVLLLFHYIEADYIKKIFSICDGVEKKDYYVKMAVAWAISICFIKFPKETMEYLKNNNLDKETHNKALQKIRESLRVDKETKEIIKGMKRS